MVQAILPDFVTYPQHLHALSSKGPPSGSTSIKPVAVPAGVVVVIVNGARSSSPPAPKAPTARVSCWPGMPNALALGKTKDWPATSLRSTPVKASSPLSSFSQPNMTNDPAKRRTARSRKRVNVRYPCHISFPSLQSCVSLVPKRPSGPGGSASTRDGVPTLGTLDKTVGSDIHVMLALRHSSRQVVVANEQLDSTDMIRELFGKRQRCAYQA